MCPLYFVTKARAVCSLPILALYEFHKRTNVALYFADDNNLLDWLLLLCCPYSHQILIRLPFTSSFF
jgi:hypothetical protein